MFAKKVEAVIWMDRTAKGDMRRCFTPLYIFDDGFPSIEECMGAVKEQGLSECDFVYLRFCGFWYAVNIHSYKSHVVVTAEHIFSSEFAFSFFSKFSIEEAKSIDFRINSFSTDRKKWQDGIEIDLRRIDPDIFIETNAQKKTSVLENNTIITFGLHFFKTEICIRTNDYVDHVFANYFNDKSLQYQAETIRYLRIDGTEYYNPFTGSESRSYAESRKKQKELLQGLDPGETITIPEIFPGVKLMREREANPPHVFRNGPKIYRPDFGRR